VRCQAVDDSAGPYPILEQLLTHVQLRDLFARVAGEGQPARQQLVGNDARRPAVAHFMSSLVAKGAIHAHVAVWSHHQHRSEPGHVIPMLMDRRAQTSIVTSQCSSSPDVGTEGVPAPQHFRRHVDGSPCLHNCILRGSPQTALVRRNRMQTQTPTQAEPSSGRNAEVLGPTIMPICSPCR